RHITAYAVEIRTEHQMLHPSQAAYMVDMPKQVRHGCLRPRCDEPWDISDSDSAVPPNQLRNLMIVQIARMIADGSGIGMRSNDRLRRQRGHIPERPYRQMRDVNDNA